eukprot:TRINITY_DN16340_c0_g1_i2.p1 TRINITY_DN16340_c0_g1~~TRINITY_DN16340_c0_g1_i2.p1  ORF type:complete len:593 (+),score=64.42 TRINITY_DN16340_c0_g1_i2:70-1779(+)
MPPKKGAQTTAQLTKRCEDIEQSLEAAVARINKLEKKLKKKGKHKSKQEGHDDTKQSKRTLDETAEQRDNTVSKKMRRENPPVAVESQPISAAVPATTPTVPADSISCSAQQVVVKDPKREHRCYDVLGISPSASPEDVKRAFKRRALKAHPDKAGGSQAAFLCLNLAYELLSDMSERARYDYELIQIKSQDGQSFKSADDAREPSSTIAEQASASPDMLCDAFLSVDQRAWPPLLEILTNQNLTVLAQHLQLQSHSKKTVTKPSDEPDRKPKGSVPGVKRQGRLYYGKIAWQNCAYRGHPTELEGALEARMALGTMKQNLVSLESAGSTFEDALRKVVTQLREKDQNSCFFFQMSFEYRGGTSRLTTPSVSDVDQFLEQRRTLLDLRDRNAPESEIKKAHGNMVQEVRQKRLRTNANKISVMASLLKHVRDMLTKRGQSVPVAGDTISSRTTSARPVVPKKQCKVVGDRKVGILAQPDMSSPAQNYMSPGAVFDVSIEHISGGFRFFQLFDGSGWLPHCSRKDPTRVVVEEVDRASDRAAILDKDDELGSDPDSSSSSSSSSSSDSDS